MRSSSRVARVRLEFRVNELEFQEVLIKPREDDLTAFQIVVKDKFLGSFALHQDVALELRRNGCAGTWERVSFEELKAAILDASRDVEAEGADNGHENAMGLLHRFYELHPVGHDEHLPRIPVEGDSSHIDRAQDALSRGKVRYQIVGGIGSRGHAWGHVTLVVRSLLAARIHLCRAGFLESSDSKCVLMDSKNGWKLYLLKERPSAEQ